MPLPPPGRSGVLVLLVAALLAACDSATPAAPTPACMYTLSASSLDFGPSGGTGAIAISTDSRCAWTAASDSAWVSITSAASGSGNGAIDIRIGANDTEAPRTGTLTVAGRAVTVREQGAAPCSFELAPASAAFNKDSATGRFSVVAPAHCTWTVASEASWLTIEGGAAGHGDGNVAYAVARNRDTTDRVGTLTVGGRAFTVTQSGDLGACEYTFDPVELAPCMSAASLVAAVTTQEACPWTAAPTAAWITVLGAHSGIGPGSVRIGVSDNWDVPRQGAVSLAGGQSLRVSQGGCRYAVSQTHLVTGPAPSTHTFDVIQQSDPPTCGGPLQNACVWTATADAAWITITTPMPQAGDGRVTFTVATNATKAVRFGTITVRDKIVRIEQYYSPHPPPVPLSRNP